MRTRTGWLIAAFLAVQVGSAQGERFSGCRASHNHKRPGKRPGSSRRVKSGWTKAGSQSTRTGGILLNGKTDYWYGENKEGRTWMPEANRSWDGYRVDVTGVRCYSSKNLYAWKDEGLVLKAEPGDPQSHLHPSKVVERPEVGFNPKTRRYVMWMHIDTADYQAARAGVAVSGSARGSFRTRGSVKPEGADSRDQTLFVDDDGKAYRIHASEWNKATYISQLSEDWLRHSGKFIKVFAGLKASKRTPYLDAAANTT